MITNPIIPIPIMIIISIIAIILILLTSKKFKIIIRLLIIIVIFFINLRPMLPDDDVEVVHNNMDVIFVVDTTLSMNALDYNNTKRLDGVKKDIEYIIDKLPGAFYSLISYENTATVKMPLTVDGVAILASKETLEPPDELYARGSSITVFKDELETVLKKSEKKDDRSRIIFIFSDGEQTKDEEPESLKSLKKYVDNGAVLGYGTTKGGNIKYTDYSGKEVYVKDKTTKYPYENAVSKLDEKNLKKMASDLNIDYIHMTKSSDIDSTLKNLNKKKNNDDKEKETAYKDLYYYYSPVLIILFLIELYLDRRSEL